ncbi:hypothetical protein RHOSPDRAFT_32393 [Rhodotorula sp. JG-1b]|nr:hypothetical protein RHOSPDRAFT_32393 [Rhodotorula sp. JG-1b]
MPFLKRLRSRSHATAEEQPTSIPVAPTEADYDAPPDARSETPPPPFSFPTTYPVGQHNHKDSQGTLFLTRSDVLAHLRLLGAFDRLRKTVERTDEGIAKDLDASSRWSLFVEVAVYRLEIYLRALMATVHDGEPEKVLPPLDVCLVLHSYLVNPFCFAEDSLRVYPVLRSMPETLLGDVAFAIDPSSLQLMLDPGMQSVWTSLTNTAFDPVQHFTSTKSRFTPDIDGFPSIEVTWFAEDGTGYAQQGFRAVTPEGIEYTHANLGLMKLAADMFKCKPDPLATMAGTVLNPWSLPDQPAGSEAARWVATRIARTLEVQRADSAHDVAVALDFDRAAAEQMFQKALGITKQPAHVLRQADYTAALGQLGWPRPEQVTGETALLDRAIARYHGFMDLIAANPRLITVPTVDIELTWQTHMLKSSYFADMKSQVGRYVDHDAAIEESALAQLFADTTEAWNARYNVPYSACACAASRGAFQPNAILSSFKSRVTGTASAAAAETKAEYSAAGYADASASHPSELLCVTYVNDRGSQQARQKRAKDAETRRKKTSPSSRSACPLGEQNGGAFLKSIPSGLHFGASGYGSTEPEGLITRADLADPSVVPGPRAFGPFALAGLGLRSAFFGGRSSWGAGWQGLAVGGATAGMGVGGFSM